MNMLINPEFEGRDCDLNLFGGTLLMDKGQSVDSRGGDRLLRLHVVRRRAITWEVSRDARVRMRRCKLTHCSTTRVESAIARAIWASVKQRVPVLGDCTGLWSCR
jgi:hypothetical protein